MAENLNLKTVETVDTRPFRKLVMTIGELPTSFIESMTYYELLAWFTNYLETVIIPTVNNNGEAVEELQEKYIELKANTEQEIDTFENEITTAFNTLKNYVDTYFDNLDVQEEINNKLDQMVETGTLQEIVADYLNSKAVFGYDTVADMKSSTNLINGSYAETVGYYAKNDGGGTLYRIRNIVVGDVTNNNTLIQMNNQSLVAEMIVNKDELNVRQFGAYGDNTHDDTSAFQSAIDKAYETKIKVINIPEGVYLISQPLEIYENRNYDLDFNYSNERHADIGYPVSKLVFQGADQYNTMLKATAGNYLFNGYATTPVAIQDVTFNDLYFNGNNVAKSTFQMNIEHFGGREIQFHRCAFNSFTVAAIESWMTEAIITAAPLRNQLRLLINDCFIGNNKNGLIIGGDDTIVTHTQISKNEEFGIIIKASVHMMTISECKIQYNGQFKVGYDGGQIKFECAGNSVNLLNNYIENKKGADDNDTGVLIFTQNTGDPSAKLLYNLNIKNCYINVSTAPCLGERIGDCTIVGINLKDNEITRIYSDKPYLFITSEAYLSTGGLIQNIRCEGNYVNARTASGTHTAIYYFYLSNEKSYCRAGSVKAEFGLWSPNTTQDMQGSIPTIISGMISTDGYTQYKKFGDYEIAKTGTGIYEITFTRPAVLGGLSASQATNYPVIVQMKFANGLDGAKVTNRSINGFHIETGTYNSEGTSFTPADKAFEFIATYMSEA